MPLYEYQCEQCGDVFEAMQKFSEEPLKTHDKCGGPVHRLLSAPALQFKGSGWYITDYAKNNGGGASSKPSNGTASSESSSSKTETSSTTASSSNSTSDKK